MASSKLSTRELIQLLLVPSRVLNPLRSPHSPVSVESVRCSRYEGHPFRQKTEMAEIPFDAFLDSAPDAIVVADQAGRIITWNRATPRLLGYSVKESVIPREI